MMLLVLLMLLLMLPIGGLIWVLVDGKLRYLLGQRVAEIWRVANPLGWAAGKA